MDTVLTHNKPGPLPEPELQYHSGLNGAAAQSYNNMMCLADRWRSQGMIDQAARLEQEAQAFAERRTA